MKKIYKIHFLLKNKLKILKINFLNKCFKYQLLINNNKLSKTYPTK